MKPGETRWNRVKLVEWFNRGKLVARIRRVGAGKEQGRGLDERAGETAGSGQKLEPGRSRNGAGAEQEQSKRRF